MKSLPDRNGKSPTEKQAKARERNWHIRQLRAYYHLCPPSISPSIRRKIQNLIDKELEWLGAEKESNRESRRRKQWESL